MFLRRPGGQSQFSRYLFNQAKSGPIRDLQSWIIDYLDDDLAVEKLAERVALSPQLHAASSPRNRHTASTLCRGNASGRSTPAP